jgi:hypothetical protein
MMRWFLARLRRLFGEDVAYSAVVVADIPDEVGPGLLYLIGERGKHWLAVMQCPCGCREPIHLGLTGTSPRWAVSGSTRAPTLSPSVHRTVECRSHFFLRQGQVIWCRNRGQ